MVTTTDRERGNGVERRRGERNRVNNSVSAVDRLLRRLTFRSSSEYVRGRVARLNCALLQEVLELFGQLRDGQL